MLPKARLRAPIRSLRTGDGSFRRMGWGAPDMAQRRRLPFASTPPRCDTIRSSAMGLFLYSVNPLLTFMIAESYRGGRHRVWCSEGFDSEKAPAFSRAALVPPSSNPADIYRQWLQDVSRRDRHSLNIERVKRTLVSLAVTWEAAGEIAAKDREEITFMAERGDIDLWRPLIYIIDKAKVESRLEWVCPADRAGAGPEYKLADLVQDEFEAIEVRP